MICDTSSASLVVSSSSFVVVVLSFGTINRVRETDDSMDWTIQRRDHGEVGEQLGGERVMNEDGRTIRFDGSDSKAICSVSIATPRKSFFEVRIIEEEGREGSGEDERMRRKKTMGESGIRTSRPRSRSFSAIPSPPFRPSGTPARLRGSLHPGSQS